MEGWIDGLKNGVGVLDIALKFCPTIPLAVVRCE